MKKLGVALLALFCLIYLANPGAGIFELIPDTLPVFGNLDEAAAVTILFMCLNYFGIKLPGFAREKEPESKESFNIKE